MAMGIDEIEFYFSPFTGIEDPRNRNTIFLAFGFENQEDPGLAEWFGELEGRRQSIDKIPIKSDEDVVSLQTILREGKTHHAGLIYARYPWKKKKEIVLGDINFLREIFCNTILAVGRVKNEKHTALCIILPDKFSPRNIQDEEQRGHLYQFVKTVTEAIVYANEPYVDFKTDVGSKIKEVFFLFASDIRFEINIRLIGVNDCFRDRLYKLIQVSALFLILNISWRKFVRKDNAECSVLLVFFLPPRE